MSKLSRFAYVKSRATLHVKPNAQEVNWIAAFIFGRKKGTNNGSGSGAIFFSVQLIARDSSSTLNCTSARLKAQRNCACSVAINSQKGL